MSGAEALTLALPGMLRRQRKAQLWVAVIFATLVTLLYQATGGWQEFSAFILFLPPLALLLARTVSGWLRREQRRQALPILAGAFGLNYAPDNKDFFPGLPAGLLPAGNRTQADHVLEGEFAGAPFRFAAVRVSHMAPSGDASHSPGLLFRGFVLELLSLGLPPKLLIADHLRTRPGQFVGPVLSTEGLTLRAEMNSDGMDYGLWAAPEADLPGARDLLENVTRLAETEGLQLYSLRAEGSAWYLTLRHAPEVFRFSGILAGKARLLADVRGASDEIALAFRLAAGLLRAEQGLAAPALPK
ncbi:hypothetical protein [Pseudogemmobacter humi]|uniref:DUF3137 domain-containing protein n=1 Tax=Pseudogemmobacter humi TaxID=2483812 RepID=A0A3P5X3Y7_9RHOB|nr:hypothetical protein [Pseudogemmobacter humi]VDC21914.1 hypothetical protein XINFAN_00672 [Pseudogemmobacter humi]